MLREFMESLDFIHMRPDRNAAAIPPHPGACYALLKPGETVAVYVTSPRNEPRARVLLDLPEGRWRAEWLHPATGEWEPPRVLDHTGGGLAVDGPAFDQDIALRLRRVRVAAK